MMRNAHKKVLMRTEKTHFTLHIYALIKLSNFNDSNIFGTMEISQGLFNEF